jgi:putative methionine-R-sulfoxide reductase with GAF domain
LFNSSSEVVAVLDIDSEKFGFLDETDMQYLEQVAEIISNHYFIDML